MEFLRPTWRQRLSYGTCAIALVFTLSLYKNTVSADPLSAAQRHWGAIATANPELLASRYSDNAVLKRSYGVSDVDEVYQGQSIYSAWQEFFQQYQIQNFQVVKQQQRDRSVEAEIQIVAKSRRGLVVVLSMSYQVQFDQTGKIIKEVWQANPELSV
ncbi:MAG: hypothetical protein LDL41_08035 [Coleofasciculus sp. S288]|nr:hypothetical protein [Coleofasciculus sp. S288]